MLTAADLLRRLATGERLPGRHVLVTAHADDETISCAALLSAVAEAWIVQLTTGAPYQDRALIEQRRQERTAALTAGEWLWPVLDGAIPGREAHRHVGPLSRLVHEALASADVVWTHPYEGGHLDHDTAAWLVQRACESVPVLRMEFASYHGTESRDVFGDFVWDSSVPTEGVILTGDVLRRKRAAMAAYTSQAAILKKFPMPWVEHYRQAPVYNFSQPSPAPRCRWDVKGYTPSSAIWRLDVAQVDVCVS